MINMTEKSRLLAALIYAFWFVDVTFAQQFYYTNSTTYADCYGSSSVNAGYLCSTAETSCNTYAYMRVDTSSYTLSYISSDLNFSRASAIAAASSLSDANADVYVGEGLYIPFNCSCSGTISSYNITYSIVPEDTFWKLSNGTFEGLTTCQAVIKANPTAEITNLQIGQKVIIPIRCACPSETQVSAGYNYLVTYPVNDGDNITSVVNRFGINLDEFLFTNNISESAQLFPHTTVLLPFLSKPTNPPNATAVTTSTSSSSSSSSSNNSRIVVYICVGVAAAVVIILAAIALIAYFTKKRKATTKTSLPTTVPADTPEKSKSAMQQNLIDVMSGFSKIGKSVTYTLEEIKQATQDFNPSTHIKGLVYRGVIKGEMVAVKKVIRNVSKELDILQKVHHANLVTLLGSCIASPQQTYLVYEYAENGALSDWLHGEKDKDFSMTSDSSSSSLSWTTRLQIALDVATALEYIHEHTTPSYVHKDIKSSNILLDNKFRGKVANFGLAKSALTTEELTRHIVGTQGYMAPEYLNFGMVSPKIDVFALGVVLLEMLSGKLPLEKDEVGKESFLYDLIEPLLGSDDCDPTAKERLRQWMDPFLYNSYPLDSAYSVAILARSCVSNDPTRRPNAREVTFTLGGLLDRAIDWESSNAMDQYQDNTIDAR